MREREVVIAGIGKRHPGISAYRPGMEVWGVNDCYQHSPEIKRFYKIYNIHKAFPECVEGKKNRFHNWRKAYDRSKALIITAKDLELNKQRILDITQLRNDNPEYVFCSSFSYAIFEAVKAGYGTIRLYRLSLNNDEYKYQGVGIMHNIRWAQAQGVQVIWPWYKDVCDRFGSEAFKDMSDCRLNYGEGTSDAQVEKQINQAVETIKTDFEKVQPANEKAMLKAEIKALGGELPRGNVGVKRLKSELKKLKGE